MPERVAGIIPTFNNCCLTVQHTVVAQLRNACYNLPMSKRPELKAVSHKGVDNRWIYDLWIKMDLAPEWRVAYRLVLQDGVLVIGEVRVLPRKGSNGHTWTAAENKGLLAVAPSGGVRSTLLRRVSIPAAGQYAQDLETQVTKWRRSRKKLEWLEGIGGIVDILDGEQVIHPPPPTVAKVHQPVTEPARPRRGRKGKGEAFYARVARTYVAEAEKGRTRGILAVIVKRHGLGNIGQARAAVYRAREMGLLGGRQPGKVSGFLTRKAKAVLAGRAPSERELGANSRPSRRKQGRRLKPGVSEEYLREKAARELLRRLKAGG